MLKIIRVVLIALDQPNCKTEVAINYGVFVNHILTFLIVSASIFIAVKLYNKLQDGIIEKETKIKIEPPSKEQVLLTEIRDLLKK